MLSGVPNLAFALGYTNASWTLKCDLASEYVCRLLQHMDEHGLRAVPSADADAAVAEEPLLDFCSGYVRRALAHAEAGPKAPWRLYQNYALDLRRLPPRAHRGRRARALVKRQSPCVGHSSARSRWLFPRRFRR